MPSVLLSHTHSAFSSSGVASFSVGHIAPPSDRCGV